MLIMTNKNERDTKYDTGRIGQRIRIERKRLDMTQDDIGAELHVVRQTFSDWERGKNLPQLSDMLSMCNMFECELGYLLCEHEEKTREATDVCRATGLSEDAFIQLQMIRDNAPNLMKVLNLILEDKHFTELLATMDRCLDYGTDDTSVSQALDATATYLKDEARKRKLNILTNQEMKIMYCDETLQKMRQLIERIIEKSRISFKED